MPGWARIFGFLHMTIQMTVLIQTLKSLSRDLRWCSFNIISSKENTMAVVMLDKSADVFYWKYESLKEY